MIEVGKGEGSLARSEIEESRLYNEDLAPVPAAKRSWSLWNIAWRAKTS